MEEYVSRALVLTKEPRGERDARYALFTERFGKIAGRTTSSRRITSKLAGHLEPGTIANVRFIEKSGTRIVDALKSSRADISLGDLGLLKDLLPDMQVEPELWAELTERPFSWNNVLRALGWDPRGALCAICGRKATWFFVPRQEFLCDTCVSKMGKNGISYIKVDL